MGRHVLFKYYLVEVSFGICLEEISIQILFAKEFPFTSCLVDVFSSDIFGKNVIFTFSVEISLQKFLVDVFQLFFARGFFWQVFCGDFSSESFW